MAPWALIAESPTFVRLVTEAGLFAKFILFLLLGLSVVSWGFALDRLRLYRRIEQQARALRHEARGMRSIGELLDLLDRGYAGPLVAILRESRRVMQRQGDEPGAREQAVADFQRASQRAIIDALHL